MDFNFFFTTSMKKTSLALLLVSMIALPAMAQSSGAYLGGNIGQAKSNVAVNAPYAVTKDSDTAYKLYGGYQFNENWAIEGGFANFGKIRAGYTVGNVNADANAKAQALYLAAVGSVPVATDISLFAKLGISRSHAKDDETSTIGTSVATDRYTFRKTTAMFGFGAQYRVTPNISVVAEYEDFGKVADNWKMKAFTVGARYAF